MPVCSIPRKRAADAAFIVKACNNHDALVKALENLLHEVDEAGLGTAKDYQWPSVTKAAREILATVGA